MIEKSVRLEMQKVVSDCSKNIFMIIPIIISLSILSVIVIIIGFNYGNIFLLLSIIFIIVLIALAWFLIRNTMKKAKRKISEEMYSLLEEQEDAIIDEISDEISKNRDIAIQEADEKRKVDLQEKEEIIEKISQEMTELFRPEEDINFQGGVNEVFEQFIEWEFIIFGNDHCLLNASYYQLFNKVYVTRKNKYEDGYNYSFSGQEVDEHWIIKNMDHGVAYLISKERLLVISNLPPETEDVRVILEDGFMIFNHSIYHFRDVVDAFVWVKGGYYWKTKHSCDFLALPNDIILESNESSESMITEIMSHNGIEYYNSEPVVRGVLCEYAKDQDIWSKKTEICLYMRMDFYVKHRVK